MGITVEGVKKVKDIGWKITKTILKTCAYVGAGIIAGAACAGVDLGPLKGGAKIVTGIGLVGIAGAVGEASANQIDKYVDDAREMAEFGESVVDKADQIREEKLKQAEATA
jgi:hypothetical protein